ncbi:MAG: response regulator [Bacteroidota bacterium]
MEEKCPCCVLIVEDNPIIAAHLFQKIEQLGCSVTGVVTSGKEALRTIGDNPPDALIVNVHLEGRMTGIQLIRRVRIKSELPVVLFSGVRESEIPTPLVRQPNVTFLPKPFLSYQLKTSLMNAMAFGIKC